MLWFQTQHISFAVPSAPQCFGFVSSHYWFSLICFPLKGSQQSTNSHLFSISHSSPRPYILPSPIHMQNISPLTGELRRLPMSRNPPGPLKQGRKDDKEYNWLSLLYSGTSTLTRHHRTEAKMTLEMTTQGHGLWIFFWNRLLTVSAGSTTFLEFSIWLSITTKAMFGIF